MTRFRIPFCMHRTGFLLVLLCVFLGVSIGGWHLGLPLAALLVVSLLLHEMGHIAMATYLGVPVHEFGLKLGGAYVRRAHAPRRSDEILIAVSGPLVNLLIVVPFLFVPDLGAHIAACNLMLGVVNLLPLPQSDGLRILRNFWAMIESGDDNRALCCVRPFPARLSQHGGVAAGIELKKAA